MNYSELFAAIQSYTENQFPDTYLADGTAVSTTTQINTFIKQAEQRIYNSVQFPSLRKNVTGTTGAYSLATPRAMYLNCPSDFLAVYSFAVINSDGSYEYLLNKDVNFIRQAYPKPSDTGLPKYYALFGPTVSGSTVYDELSFLFGPTPDLTYSVELHYYYYPTSIVQGQLSTVSIAGGSGFTNGTYQNVSLISFASNGTGAKATIVVSGGSVTSVVVTGSGSGYSVGDTLTVTYGELGTGGTGFVATVAAVLNSAGTSWLGDNFDSVLLYGSLVEAYTFMKGEADLVALYNGKYNEALAMAKRLGDGMERQDAYRSGQYRQPVT